MRNCEFVIRSIIIDCNQMLARCRGGMLSWRSMSLYDVMSDCRPMHVRGWLARSISLWIAGDTLIYLRHYAVHKSCHKSSKFLNSFDVIINTRILMSSILSI